MKAMFNRYIYISSVTLPLSLSLEIFVMFVFHGVFDAHLAQIVINNGLPQHCHVNGLHASGVGSPAITSL